MIGIAEPVWYGSYKREKLICNDKNTIALFYIMHGLKKWFLAKYVAHSKHLSYVTLPSKRK